MSTLKQIYFHHTYIRSILDTLDFKLRSHRSTIKILQLKTLPKTMETNFSRLNATFFFRWNNNVYYPISSYTTQANLTFPKYSLLQKEREKEKERIGGCPRRTSSTKSRSSLSRESRWLRPKPRIYLCSGWPAAKPRTVTQLIRIDPFVHTRGRFRAPA